MLIYKIMNDFACFILSHGRADNLYTYNTLRKCGYTGRIYILIDNEDKTADRYYELYGKEVIMFDKKEQAKKTDSMGNFEGRKAIVYARNANFEIAKKLAIRYFLQLDDDSLRVSYRNVNTNMYGGIVKNLDRLFTVVLNFYKSTPVISIAFAQGGDFIGGTGNEMLSEFKIKRKCMNSWFMDTTKPINFVGKMNEDLTASVYYGNLGQLFLTIPLIQLLQIETQQNTGGMTDIYLDNGTYVKTFYSIMKTPSCVKVAMLNCKNRRLHHNVSWNNAVPKIINEKNKAI